MLLRGESAASSEIEHLTANARRISLARLGDRSRPNATLIARNTNALEAALQLAATLDVDAMLTMHRALLENSEPQHADLPEALGDLVRFMARTDMPAPVQAEIAHAQFETIHPFIDGNGRTGRALVSAILRARGTTQNFTVPLSSGLLTTTKSYFAALDEYRQGNIEPIIMRFIDRAGNRTIVQP